MDNDNKSPPLVASEENESAEIEPNKVDEKNVVGGEASTVTDEQIKQTGAQTRRSSTFVNSVRMELDRFGMFFRDLISRARQKYCKLANKHGDASKSKQEMTSENEDQFNETVTEKLIVSDESKEDKKVSPVEQG